MSPSKVIERILSESNKPVFEDCASLFEAVALTGCFEPSQQ
jgi:hypothetical protein